jgi:very-short-patch-repair endonuclease
VGQFVMKKIIPYNPKLVPLAKKLRQDMTLSEVLLWNELKQNQLGFRFSRQISIDEYIVDFYSKDLMLVIEIDGDSHYHEDQPRKDEIRQKRLESLGVWFLRFDDIDIKRNMNWVIEQIFHWITDHKPTPSPSQEGN